MFCLTSMRLNFIGFPYIIYICGFAPKHFSGIISGKGLFFNIIIN